MKPSPTQEQALALALQEIHDLAQVCEAERLAMRNALKLLVRRLGLQADMNADLLMLASVLKTPDAAGPRHALEGLAAELLALGGRP